MNISSFFYTALVLGMAAYGVYTDPSGVKQEPVIEGLVCERSVTIIEVLDGDTLKTDAYEKIRLTGINTPELGEPGGYEAKNFTEQMVLGISVCINVDNARPLDKYHKTLAVVLVDGINLNKLLLKEGLAEVMYIRPSEFDPYRW